MDFITQYDWTGLVTSAGVLLIKLVIMICFYFIVRSVGMRIIKHLFAKFEAQNSLSIGRAHTLRSLTLNVFAYILIFIFSLWFWICFIMTRALF